MQCIHDYVLYFLQFVGHTLTEDILLKVWKRYDLDGDNKLDINELYAVNRTCTHQCILVNIISKSVLLNSILPLYTLFHIVLCQYASTSLCANANVCTMPNH